jgi:phage-related protein
MAGIGAGVKEIRVWDEAGSFPVVYVANLAEAVDVLHWFQKKTEQTSDGDARLARKRFKDLTKERKWASKGLLACGMASRMPPSRPPACAPGHI